MLPSFKKQKKNTFSQNPVSPFGTSKGKKIMSLSFRIEKGEPPPPFGKNHKFVIFPGNLPSFIDINKNQNMLINF